MWEGEDVERGGKWTTLPHDITIPRRVPEIEFCHRSIVTRARQRSPRSLSTRLRHALLPVNKLYHGSTAGRGRRTVDTLLTFSRHSLDGRR